MKATLLAKTAEGDEKEVKSIIEKMPCVKYAMVSYGNWDIVAHMEASVEEIDGAITSIRQDIKSIRETQTLVGAE